MMSEIIDMKAKAQCESEEDQDDDICDRCSDECPIEEVLKKEYQAIMDWAFGKHFTGESKERTKEIWRALHPGLVEPRILDSQCGDPLANTIGMLLDVLPKYLEHKKKEGR